MFRWGTSNWKMILDVFSIYNNATLSCMYDFISIKSVSRVCVINITVELTYKNTDGFPSENTKIPNWLS